MSYIYTIFLTRLLPSLKKIRVDKTSYQILVHLMPCLNKRYY